MRHHLSRRLTILGATIALALGAPLGVALASHQFSDVPSSSPFHGDIQALAAAGVTAGCGGGNFCPKANVTREQMAAFMNRLGALAPGKTPVVNADKLDGRHATELIRVAEMSTGATTVIPTSGEVTYGTPLSIVAPTAGFVVINGAVTVRHGAPACSADCNVHARIRHIQSGSDGAPGQAALNTTADARESIALGAVFAVNAGTNTFDIRLLRFSGVTGTITGWWGSLTAVFSPFGSTGGSTLGALETTTLDPAKEAELLLPDED